MKETDENSKKKFLERIKSEDILKDTKDWVWIVDREGRPEYANETALEESGYSLEELKKKRFEPLAREEDVERVKHVLKDTLNGEKNSYEVRVKTKKGEKVLEVTTSPIKKDGEVVGAISFGRDITKQKEAIKELKEKQKELKTLFDNIPGMAYRCKNDRNWTMKFLSKGCKEITGYEPEEFIDNNERAFNDIIHPEDQERVWKSIQKAVEKDESFKVEYRITTSEGEEKWVWERGRAVESPEEGPEILEGIITDITEKKKVKKELEESEEKLRREKKRFRKILNNTNDAIYLAKVDENGMPGQFEEVNDVACERLGYSREELEEMSPKDIDAEEKGKKIRKVMDELLSEGEATFEMVNVAKDGEEIPVELSSHLIELEGEKKILTVSRDIRKRKKAEKRYQAIFENTGAATLVIEKDKTISLVNKGFETLSGYPKEEIEGKKKWTEFVTDEYLEKMEEYHEQRRTGEGNPPNRYEFDFVDGDENVHRCVMNIDVIPGTKKTIASILDITERKEAEEKVKEKQEYLNNIINAINDPIFVKNEDHEWILLNDAYCDFMGYDREELLGKTDRDFFPEEEADVFWEKDEKVFETGENDINEEKFTDGQGKTHTIVTHKSLFETKDGKKLLVGTIRDITERKKAKEKLEKAQERLESAMEAGKIAWWEMELPSGKVEFSERKPRMLGYSPEKFETYEDFTDLLHPEDYDKAMKAMKDHLEGKKDSYEVEYRIKESDGSYRWLKDMGRITEEDEDYKKVTGVVVDIDKRKRSEKKVKERKKRFENALSEAPFPIMLHAEDGEVLKVNNVWTELTGYTQEEIPTIEEWTKKAYEERSEEIKKDIEEVSKKKRSKEGEYRVRTKSGEERIWDFSSARIGKLPDGRKIVISIANDITERKKMQKKLEKERERAQTYLDTAGTMIVILDKEGKIKKLNEKACEVLGYEKKEEAIGKNWFDNFLPPRTREKTREYFKELMEEPEATVKEHENPIVTKDGEEKTILWNSNILKDGGKVTGLISSGLNITERKKKEKEIQERKEELEKFNELAVDREMKMKELKEENKELKQRIKELKEEGDQD